MPTAFDLVSPPAAVSASNSKETLLSAPPVVVLDRCGEAPVEPTRSGSGWVARGERPAVQPAPPARLMTADSTTRPVTRRRALALGGVALGGTVLGGTVVAGDSHDSNGTDDENGDENDERGGDDGDRRQYRVTVANLTPGQPFTPPAVALHTADVEVFAVGEPANEPTQELAENGNLAPLLDLLDQTEDVLGAGVGDFPLVPQADPGETGFPSYTSLHVAADADAEFLTFVSMLVATNDGIVGLDTVPLPAQVNESRTYFAAGYDVGTERNTEAFTDLVPPAQALILGQADIEGTTQSDPALAEDGVIRPHPGIRGVAGGDLDPETFGWDEPAALVQVERLDEFRRRFSTDLSGTNEVPPVETAASGSASFELEESGGGLAYEVRVTDVENAVASHIHCGATDANGPVGVTLFSGDPVSPDGVLAAGTITEPDPDNACGWDTVDDVVDAIRSGHTYVNVHTQANPSGEIRGQLH